MQKFRHGAVCMDHAEARIFGFSKDDYAGKTIHATGQTGNLHHKAGSVGPGHQDVAAGYFAAVIAELEAFDEILVMGHGTAKAEFVRHVKDHRPQLASRILGVETVDHPTDSEIVTLARKFLHSRGSFASREA